MRQGGQHGSFHGRRPQVRHPPAGAVAHAELARAPGDPGRARRGRGGLDRRGGRTARPEAACALLPPASPGARRSRAPRRRAPQREERRDSLRGSGAAHDDRVPPRVGRVRGGHREDPALDAAPDGARLPPRAAHPLVDRRGTEPQPLVQPHQGAPDGGAAEADQRAPRGRVRGAGGIAGPARGPAPRPDPGDRAAGGGTGMTTALAAGAFAIVWSAAVPQGTAAREADALRPGDYAGWAFLSAGGDFPLRWRCRDDQGATSVTVSLPHQRTLDLAAECSVGPDGETTVELKDRRGAGLSFTGVRAGDGVRGVLRMDGRDAGSFELVQSAVPLPTVRPESYAGAAGLYRSAAGECLQLTTWPWGELLVLDLTSGAERTLFAAGEDEFVAGPSLGLPAPVEARFLLLRGTDDRVAALERRDDRGPAREYERLLLHEEELSFPSGDATLRGTLIEPASPTPLPAIVILGGSDVTLREHVQATAQIYASFGIAALAYDLRGHGQSTGERDCTLAHSADDACAAIEALGRRADIDARRIGIAGTSRGGWTAPLAASRCDRVRFLVLFVAPAVTPERQLTHCWLASFVAAGHDESEASEAAAYLDLLWRCTESELDWERYQEARTSMREKGWLALLGGPSSRESEEYHWQRLNAQYDPIPALERTTCPVLALYGEHDGVVRAAENLPLMESALERGGNRDATLRVIAGVDHGLWRVDPARPARPVPIHRALGFGPEVWSTVRLWLDERIHG